MKTAYKITCLALLLVLLVVSATNILSAAPRASGDAGPQPLYDSGWVLTSGGAYQTFNHNLNGFPIHIEVFVADDANGSWPVKVADHRYINGSYYGGSVRDVYCNSLKMFWQPHGIAYNSYLQKWYQRGTDYARVMIFSTKFTFGGPPCRP